MFMFEYFLHYGPMLLSRVRIKPGRKPGQLIGKSPYLQSVVVQAPPRLIGQIVDVHIEEAGPNSLKGHVVMEAAA